MKLPLLLLLITAGIAVDSIAGCCGNKHQPTVVEKIKEKVSNIIQDNKELKEEKKCAEDCKCGAETCTKCSCSKPKENPAEAKEITQEDKEDKEKKEQDKKD